MGGDPQKPSQTSRQSDRKVVNLVLHVRDDHRRLANLWLSPKPRRVPMSDSISVQRSVDRMKIYMELRGLRPNTV